MRSQIIFLRKPFFYILACSSSQLWRVRGHTLFRAKSYVPVYDQNGWCGSKR